MRAVIQRVKQASVSVEDAIVGAIGPGLLVLLAVHKADLPIDTSWMVKKIANLRIFADSAGKMNQSVKQTGGRILVVSQFTLYGNCMDGRRPDFFDAATGEKALTLYQKFVQEMKNEMGTVEQGVFGAHMQISLVNDGPVTLCIESKAKA